MSAISPIILQGDVDLQLWTTYDRSNPAGVVEVMTEPTAPSAPASYNGDLGGAAHFFMYDSMGRVVRENILDGGTTIDKTWFFYDELGRVKRSQEYVYAAGTSQFLGCSEVSILYGAGKASQVAKVSRSGDGFQSDVHVEYEYDLAGRRTIVRDSNANPNVTSISYHANSNFVSQVDRQLDDPAGPTAGSQTIRTKYEFDFLGRLTEIRELGANPSDDLVHQFSYYTLGMTFGYLDPELKGTTFLPDALGRLVQSSKNSGSGGVPNIVNSTVYVDWTGNNDRTRVEQTDGHEVIPRLTVTHYDFAGRPFILQKPGAEDGEPSPTTYKRLQEFYEYDAASRLVRRYSGLDAANPGPSTGIQTEFFYDGAGRLIVQRSPNAHLLGGAVSVLSTQDVFYRDKLGRITDTVSAGGDIAAGFVNAQIQFQEDSIGRVHKERYYYAGYAPGNVIDITSGFDEGKLFRSSLTYSDGLQMTYTPDGIDRLDRIDWQQPGGGQAVTLAQYKHMGSRVSERTVDYGGATGTTDFSFDVYGRLESIVDMVSTDPEPVAGFQYVYDKAGNLLKEYYLPGKQDDSVGDRFVYDTFHRLKEGWLGVDQATMESDPISGNPVQKLTYNLDTANNRTSVVTEGTGSGNVQYLIEDGTHPDGPSNRYNDVDGDMLTYDGRGNTKFDGRFFYVYDYMNRLSEVYTAIESVSSGGGSESLSATSSYTLGLSDDPEAVYEARAEILRKTGGIQEVLKHHGDAEFQSKLSAPLWIDRNKDEDSAEEDYFVTTLVLKAAYVHDGFNRRIVRGLTEGGIDIRLSAYDGWREVEELVPQGNPAGPVAVKQFIWGDRLDEQVAYKEWNTQTSEWDIYFINNGGQDSVTRILNADGEVVQAKEYDPYGIETNFPILGNTSNPYSWKGHRLDPETGLIYMRNRYYNPYLGRFMTQDPIGIWGDRLNLGNAYCYAANAPQVRWDPFGLQGGPPTPTLDDLANQGIRFGDATPPGPSSHPSRDSTRLDSRTIVPPSRDPALERLTIEIKKELEENLILLMIPFPEFPGGLGGVPKGGGGAKGAPKPSPKFKPPTNPPQYPPKEIPPGWRVREMPPTEQYPNGYWKLEKPMKDGSWQPIDPSTMKPGGRPQTHIPFPPKGG